MRKETLEVEFELGNGNKVAMKIQKKNDPTRPMKKLIVNQRRFHIWKLELWWVAFDSPQFYPDGRTKIKGNWFWRNYCNL
jgi:hypothetical protein